MLPEERLLKLLLMLSLTLLIAVTALFWTLYQARDVQYRDTANLASNAITLLPEPKALVDFTLRDDAERVFDLASLRGKWSFVFFGFTFCPDICPTTLADLARLRKRIIAAGVDEQQLQLVFVSVDPARDSAAIIQDYVRHFDASILGTTGSAAQLTNLSRQLGAPYKVEYAEDEYYPVYHSSAVYLIDPMARHSGVLRAPFRVPETVEEFSRLRREADYAARS